MIAFSTDTSVSSRGVYLLSFLIEGYVDRIMEYAQSKGKKSFAAMAPQSDYGNIAVAEFQQAASRLGVRVVTIARYAPGQAAGAAQEIAGVANQIDALFIPEQADGMDGVSAALVANGVKTQILGTGIWNDAARDETAGVAGRLVRGAGERRLQRFRRPLSRQSSTAIRRGWRRSPMTRSRWSRRWRARKGRSVLPRRTLVNASGFNGADGVFRFRAEGPNERGLAVLQINNGAASVVSAAPRSFAGG